VANNLSATVRPSYCMARNNVIRAYESYRLGKKRLSLMLVIIYYDFVDWTTPFERKRRQQKTYFNTLLSPMKCSHIIECDYYFVLFLHLLQCRCIFTQTNCRRKTFDYQVYTKFITNNGTWDLILYEKMKINFDYQSGSWKFGNH